MTVNDPNNHHPASERVTVRRLGKRGHYDPATINEILDAGFICHVGFTIDGQPRVIPTAYVRIADSICLHGSPGNQMLRALLSGGETCVCVTHVDGLVLARSAFHHSINYRSVVLFGRAREISDSIEKAAVLEALSEHIIPGRWRDIRPPTAAELTGTLVVGIHIDEASAKIRSGPPKDDEEDYALPIWAGVLPLRTIADEPIRDPRLPAEIPTPMHVVEYRRDHGSVMRS
jgi:nitroimidazol reductase NimA-like FMN-containing flavoprotein (pyridoxamine 5'-phosphate oxidase superfamily)